MEGEGTTVDELEIEAATLSEAVDELYEDLRSRVGRELHRAAAGHYRKPKKIKEKKKVEKKKSPDKSKEASWSMTPWRPGDGAKKKKKKKAKEPPEPRRPFGPASSSFPLNDEGDVKYAEMLLSPWGDKEAIDWPDPLNDGASPLIVAAARGKSAMVAILLSNSASVFVRTESGNTALHEASKGGFLDVVLALLRAGSDVDAINKFGNTPLSASVRNNHLEVSEILVLVGASVDIKNNNGETPMDRTDDPDFRAFLMTKRNRFLQLSQKRIAAKQRELELLRQQKEEGEESEEAKEETQEEAITDTVPVLTIVADFLARQAKAQPQKSPPSSSYGNRARSPSLSPSRSRSRSPSRRQMTKPSTIRDTAIISTTAPKLGTSRMYHTNSVA